ncbi:unnamed protein product, partial [Heterobilharzia americana]
TSYSQTTRQNINPIGFPNKRWSPVVSGLRCYRKPPPLNISFYLQVLSITDFFGIAYYILQTGGPVLAQMDPQGKFIHFRLFREATRYKEGKHIKDLSCLNRDLSRVVLVDWDPIAAQLQPRNSLIIKRWDGDESDRELIDLAAFLRSKSSCRSLRLEISGYFYWVESPDFP